MTHMSIYLFFSHPDYTVGSGISPNQPSCENAGKRFDKTGRGL